MSLQQPHGISSSSSSPKKGVLSIMTDDEVNYPEIDQTQNDAISTAKRRHERDPDDSEYRSLKRKYQENEEIGSSSLSLVPSSSLARNWTHDVFPSFRGEDVRKNFLSHIIKEFRRKGITPFIDNEIERGESIAPELISAIRGSKIAIVLLSRNYASSKWCLDELVEIMKCREELGQIVLAIFYEVDPSDVKKLNGDFGEVFRKTCVDRNKEETERWSQALAKVAVIAGYHSINWKNEADMIEKIAIDVSRMLISSAPSNDFDRFVGMRTHMGEMEPFLRLESDEVRMIGIWGTSGIGKSTIARVLFGQYSSKFQLSVFMENIKRRYPIPYYDEYSAQLQLQTEMLSQIINQKDIKIHHLGALQDRLNYKKVLVVLDDVDHLLQLDALAKETRWFGRGSRIIITTQDKRLLNAHGVEHIYKVGFPADDEALQIFSMYAFGQKFPKDGFESLAREVTQLAGNLPMGLRVMGSYFRGMSKREWEMVLPRLWTSLDGEIESILKFSYNALCDEDKDLFIHIACFFNNERIERVEEFLAEIFFNVRCGLHVLAEKSLISIDRGWIQMHDLLVRFGIEIVRKQSNDPRQRRFLVDAKETCQVLNNYTQGNINVIGIKYNYSEIDDELYTNDKVIENASNLQFLRVHGYDTLMGAYVPESLIYLPRTLRLLHWEDFSMTCLPSNFNAEFLVEIYMPDSKLEKLWEGNQNVTNLKWMNLTRSKNLKEVPDLSTATNLQELDLSGCSSLVELPFSIGNATNLKCLDLSKCSSLVELPSSIENAINLKKLNLIKLEVSGCSSLVELPSSIGNLTSLKCLNLSYCSSLVKLPSSIENAINLSGLILLGCSSLVELPSSIGNVINLKNLDLTLCSSLMELPSSIGNAINLKMLNLSGCSSLVKLPSSIGNLKNLWGLILKGCSSLMGLPPSIGNAINLQELYLGKCSSLVELPFSIGNAINLGRLNLSGCSSLVELPSSIGNATNLKSLNLSGCSSLVELPSSIGNLHNLRRLILERCSKLESLPININMKSLEELDLSDCSLLKTFPEISTNISRLRLNGTAIEEIPSSIRSWSRLRHLAMSYCENLGKSPHAIDRITELHVRDERIRELAPWIKEMSRIEKLVINGCTKLVSLPQLPDSLRTIEAENCESLEKLDPSFHNTKVVDANFGNCFKLNQEARDLIIRTCTSALLPGERVPTYFRWRAMGSSLSLKWTGTDTETMRYKACVLLVNKGDAEVGDRKELSVSYCIMDKQHDYYIKDKQTGNDVACGYAYQSPLLKEHLVFFDVEQYASCGELVFEFKVNDETCEIIECGLN